MTDLTYEECHAKHDRIMEYMTNMDLIKLLPEAKKYDMPFWKAIHWELKLRVQKLGKYEKSVANETD